jgi:hypothetical protein
MDIGAQASSDAPDVGDFSRTEAKDVGPASGLLGRRSAIFAAAAILRPQWRARRGDKRCGDNGRFEKTSHAMTPGNVLRAGATRDSN